MISIEPAVGARSPPSNSSIGSRGCPSAIQATPPPLRWRGWPTAGDRYGELVVGVVGEVLQLGDPADRQELDLVHDDASGSADEAVCELVDEHTGEDDEEPGDRTELARASWLGTGEREQRDQDQEEHVDPHLDARTRPIGNERERRRRRGSPPRYARPAAGSRHSLRRDHDDRARAWCESWCGTLPSRSSANPPDPRRPTTIMVASRSSAMRISVSLAVPSSSTVSHSIPASAGFAPLREVVAVDPAALLRVGERRRPIGGGTICIRGGSACTAITTASSGPATSAHHANAASAPDDWSTPTTMHRFAIAGPSPYGRPTTRAGAPPQLGARVAGG